MAQWWAAFITALLAPFRTPSATTRAIDALAAVAQKQADVQVQQMKAIEAYLGMFKDLGAPEAHVMMTEEEEYAAYVKRIGRDPLSTEAGPFAFTTGDEA